MPANTAWTSAFEALVAEIAAKFLDLFDASRERCWIAEVDGEPVGSVFLVQAYRRGRQAATAAGRNGRARAGTGPRLVERMHRASRAQMRLRKITLWTQSILVAARGIYQDAGFELVATEPHRSFGQT